MKAKDYQEQRILEWKEEELQNHCIHLAKMYGWIYYHTHDSRRSNPGFPDLVLIHPRRGTLLIRELKRQKRWSYGKGQREWLDAFTAAGTDAGLWQPADVVSGRVERELAPPPIPGRPRRPGFIRPDHG